MDTVTIGQRLQEAFDRCRDMDGSVNERLASYANALKTINPDFADAVQRLIDRLQQSGSGENAPMPGDPMPPFALPDEAGRIVTLQSLLEKGPAIITFQRGHWCPFCRINLAAISQNLDAILSARGQIIAITPDRQEFSAAFKSDAAAHFPILTDIDNGYALSLNLAIWVGLELERMMADRGRSLPLYQGNNAWLLPIPATFVVATNGIIRRRFVDPDFRRRMDIDDLIDAVQSA